jgi:hypothetical protein
VFFCGIERRAQCAPHRCDRLGVAERISLDRYTFSKERANARRNQVKEERSSVFLFSPPSKTAAAKERANARRNQVKEERSSVFLFSPPSKTAAAKERANARRNQEKEK